MANGETVRVFISSPSDVEAERRRAARVMERVNGELDSALRFEPILWEDGFYRATDTFQPQIPDVAAVDIVVCILWKRLGSDLPPEFNRADGSPRTGTEWEFETAMAAALAQELPDIFLFRKTLEVSFRADAVDLERAQFKALESFWEKWVQNEQGHFSAAFQHFESTDEFEAQFERLLRSWLASRQAEVTWPIEVNGSPFRGLEAYDAGHASVFFGRRRAVREGVAKLSAAARRGHAFLLLLGMSGSGKSSLARAGLLPRLLAGGAVDGVDRWRACVMRPGDDPLGALSGALYGADGLPELADGDCPDAAALMSLISGHPQAILAPVRGALKRWGAAIAEAESYGRVVETRLVLLVDQLEELATLSRDGQAAFVDALGALADSGQVWVVATLRSDFYGVMQGIPGLVALKEAGAVQDVMAPGPAEIREIIEGPAKAAGLIYGDDPETGQSLSAILEQAAGSPESLPLLNFMLQALFERRDRASNMMLPSVYAELGGLEGAIEARAEEVFNGLDETAQGALPALIRLLVTVNEDDVATARMVTLDPGALSPGLGLLIDGFVAARLLVTGGDDRGTTLRVTHEALLTHWVRARDGIHQDLNDLRLRARLEGQAGLWQAANRAAARLLHGELELSEAADLSRRLRDELEPALLAFVDASLAAARERRERALRRTRMVAAAMAVLAILSGIGGYLGVTGQREAEQQMEIAKAEHQKAKQAAEEASRQTDIAQAEHEKAKRAAEEAQRQMEIAQTERALAHEKAIEALKAQSRYLVASADEEGDEGNVELAMALLAEALPRRRDHSDRPFLRDALQEFQGLKLETLPPRVLIDHESDISAMDYAPDGKTVATVHADGICRIWEAESGRMLSELSGLGIPAGEELGVGFNPGPAMAVVFSADGSRLATVNSATERLGDTEGPVHERELAIVTVWDSRTGRRLTEFYFYIGYYNGGANGIERYGVEGEDEWQAFPDFVFSPDLREAVMLFNGSMVIWNVETGEQVGSEAAPVYDGIAKHASFTADGKYLAIAMTQHIVAVSENPKQADGSDGETVAESGETADPIPDEVAKSDDALPERAGTGDPNYTGGPVILLDSPSLEPEKVPRTGSVVSPLSEVWNPKDILVPSRYPDHEKKFIVVLLDRETKSEVHRFEGYEGPVTDLALSRDGKRLATASLDGYVRIWERPSGKQIRSVQVITVSPDAIAKKAVDHYVKKLALSFEGDYVAAVGNNGTVQQWSVETGEEVKLFTATEGLPAVDDVLFSPDGGRLIMEETSGRIRIWHREERIDQLKFSYLDQDGELQALKNSHEGQGIAGLDQGGNLKIWNLTDAGLKQAINVAERFQGDIYPGTSQIAYSPDARYLVWLSGNDSHWELSFWNAKTFVKERTISGNTTSDSVYRFAISGDGQHVATVSNAEPPTVWDVESGRQVKKLEMPVFFNSEPGNNTLFPAIEFSPDGAWLAASSGGGPAGMWDLRSGQSAISVTDLTEAGVSHLAFSPDGRHLVLAKYNGHIEIWDVEKGEKTRDLTDHDEVILWLSYSPDGSKLAFLSLDRTVHVLNGKTGELLHVLDHSPLLGEDKSAIDGNTLVFSPDGDRLATAIWGETERGDAFLWDTRTGRLVATLDEHKDLVNFVEFSPDGRQLATTSWDGTIIIWDGHTGQELASFDAGKGSEMVWDLAFSPDGQRLATNGVIDMRVWDTRLETIASIRAKMHRSLSEEEREEYFLSAEPVDTAWKVDDGPAPGADASRDVLQAAAKKGSALAHERLGALHAAGAQGVPADAPRAMYHYEIARRLHLAQDRPKDAARVQILRANLANFIDDPEILTDWWWKAVEWTPARP